MATMHSADAAWLRMDRATNPMVINCLLRFDDRIEPARLRDRLQERLVDRFPRFRQRPAGDALRGMRWEDDPRFDLTLHVQHVALPEPADETALRTLVSDLISIALDHERPLWTVTLIDGPGPGCALLSRMHHCIADGIVLARVMLTLADGAAALPPAAGDRGRRGVPLPPALGARAGAAPSAAASIAHEATETLVDPRHVGDLARTAARDAGIVAKFVVNRPDARTPLHDELGVGQRVAWSPPIPLEGVRSLAHVFGVTINDVLLAAVTGVLGDHLRSAVAAVPDEIHAMVPFNLRASTEPLPRDLGNRFGLLLLALPVGRQAPVTRLLEIHRRTDAIKHSHEGQIAYGILGAMGLTPSGVEARLIDLFSAKASAVVTNVPGPREPLAVTGARLDDVLVWAPSSGSVGLSVSIFSYAGHVTIGFLVNRRLTDDPQTLADGVLDQLEALAQATSAGSSAGAG
jgi:WS/DGAT/MGAT family acyltransferase